ncbi:hypothetical protein BU24DRAFT_262300 [Aaosphaeria arxii CBS 175.79]|uniref:Zn(2)-C6 fungal-type domain-containing protein n=1 Tax=Aaosphaeria arxii CBS 175.79 TaxID=1450172 RepID=A0A6A5XJS0_9PLEO|nr:uncharacterized protein BU24DRAFT_262300 [Aaosphaeria arxii CBS 175.79]KAF2012980.1 hypothetical protein BU24DRAFT_262300 [Aaosphaeria arxii CBS 175.79]
MELSDGTRILSREEASQFLRTQRKGNRKKACFPCHERKVGCDGSRPCKRCVEREHPAMCSYEPVESIKKRKIASVESARTTEPTPSSTSPNLVSMNRSLSNEQSSTPTDQFVGDSSVPGFIMNGLSHRDERESGISNKELRSLLLPALGLARTDCVWPTESEEITFALARAAEALPRSPEIIRLFQQYKQVVYPLNPHILDLPIFEPELVTFLSSIEQVKSGQATGISLPWIAIMFAVIAAGLQFSDLSLDERAFSSRRYARQALACLQAESGFITASVPAITAILILVTVLQNNLATEAAWSYLGLASRLAQSLGLHRSVSPNQSSGDSLESSLWKAIVWQDCLLSMCFGRQPCTSLTRKGHCPSSETHRDLDYRDAMYLLTSTSLEFITEEVKSLTQLTSQASQLEQEIGKAKPELRIREKCRSIEDHMEHLAFRLNTSFAMATLLRPSLKAEPRWQAHQDEQRKLRRLCVDACVTAVESFISLHKLSVVAERSWAILHNGLSCALVLLLIDEARRNVEIKQLQQELVSIMSQSSKSRDQGSLLWGPHARILAAVKLLDPARSTIPSSPPPVQGVFPSEQRTLSPLNNRGSGGGETILDEFNSLSNDLNNNNSNALYDFSSLDLNQESLSTLYDSIMWGDYQI